MGRGCLLKTLGTQMGYPIQALIWVAVKVNDLSFSTDFVKLKMFQLIFQIIIYATVVFYKKTPHSLGF